MNQLDLYPPYEDLDPTAVLHATAMFDALGFDLESVHSQLLPYRYVYYLTYLQDNAPPNGREFHLTVFPNADPKMTGLVRLPGIPFWAACSHHSLPFVGTVTVGYVPDKYVIGISKLPMYVREKAKGFWMQEQFTEVLADELYNNLEAHGVGVFVKAVHTCQLLDLGQPPIPVMEYTALRGSMFEGPLRLEFTALSTGVAGY